jgi:hypothetical protein
MDSGNGGYLLVLIDFANDKASTELVKRFIEYIDLLFSDEHVQVDRTMFNAARIIRLAGTMNRKGDNSPDRPWRWSRMLEAPANSQALQFLTPEFIARFLPQPESNHSVNGGARFNLEDFIEHHGIAVKDIKSWVSGIRKFTLEHCVFDDTHRGTSAVILQFPSGAQDYRCLHNTCVDRRWPQVREKYEPNYRQRQNSRTVEFTVGGELPPFAADEEGPEEPRPLHREPPPTMAFPLDNLPTEIKTAVLAIHEVTQASISICGQSGLAATNLATQPHFNVELPTGEVKPISEFFITIAETGERKTSADEHALTAVRKWEADQREAWDEARHSHSDDLAAWEAQRRQI